MKKWYGVLGVVIWMLAACGTRIEEEDTEGVSIFNTSETTPQRSGEVWETIDERGTKNPEPWRLM